ncbi:hypothetical protein Ga0061079_1312 [Apibacter mensalis]|uniref:Uncharacterized protein n=1 Tax=Apibacter mensalis TaxID=1586267 RepID=A0A0X3ASC8_9FLAO|nr:hypothetical protein [Apibacter mensalis]CVK17244.1 hypothetical protein Ga0061079_1312 [Apibacter mensalis]
MNTTNEILQALGISYWQYDHYREQCFYRWCIEHSYKSFIDIRQLYQHDGVRNWYLDTWVFYVEKPFIRENKDFFVLNEKQHLVEILTLYTYKLERFYPQTLLKIIKKENHAVLNNRRSKREDNFLK